MGHFENPPGNPQRPTQAAAVTSTLLLPTPAPVEFLRFFIEVCRNFRHGDGGQHEKLMIAAWLRGFINTEC